MLGAIFRAFPIQVTIALIAVVSIVTGFVVSFVGEGRRAPVEKALALAQEGDYAAAEDAYFELAANHPGEVPFLLALLDNHERLRESVAAAEDRAQGRHERAVRKRQEDFVERDARVDAFFAHLPPESALLGGYWHRALRGAATEEELERIMELASADPPAPWANHVVGRERLHKGDDVLAATHFAREARTFEPRRADAEFAYGIWSARNDWKHLNEALDDPRFANQLGPAVRFRHALGRGDWALATRLFFASQYDEAGVGVVVLALLSAAVWFAICLGFAGEVPERRFYFLYGAAFVLGIASTYLTLSIMVVAHHFFPFLRSHAADLIGVGLREELAKGLMVVVPLLVARRWGGGQREAVACGALVGLGFAAEENVGYFAAGLSTALLRFLTANFFHISTTGFVALSIDATLRGKVTKGNGIAWTLAFVVVMHTLYDAFIELGGGSSFVVLIFYLLVAWRFLRALRDLRGQPSNLLPRFAIGMALVVGASFVYASGLVGPRHAAFAMASSLLGAIIVIAMFVRELAREA
jgi:RsiW-degrading membrane proteinase PrsW (M82 family)